MVAKRAIGMHAIVVRQTRVSIAKSMTAINLLASFVDKGVEMPSYFLLGLLDQQIYSFDRVYKLLGV